MRSASVRRRAVSVLLPVSLFASLLLLAACGKQETPAAPAATPEPAAAPAPAPASAPAATAPAAAAPAAAPAPAAAVTPIPKGPPVKVTPELVAEGKVLFNSAGCTACHGGTGGGGMCPPLTNDIWVYGSDDDTLRTLITEGTAGMTAHGKTRIGHEKVVGQMPPFGPVLKPGDTEKLLAFIHSINKTAGATQ
ncbi:c-type cytochrome [Xanthomonas sp. LF06-19]|uniref:c-type cytochrome n=1 Tax=Xanthomonas sp. LF06-19 TaxID=3097551 RepID=UPI002A7FA36D|nr:c-type cytochrome [Xanthomonas sp. LF06-19]MDY4285711.1 c-type cytochrome [Xanthomonas sp. LF06-19]